MRFLLCFWIVICHCSKASISKNYKKYFNKGFHVPTFFLISFYFFYDSISQRAIGKIIARFQRLFIPYIFWPLFIFISNNLLYKIISVGQFAYKLKIKDLFVQLVVGAKYHTIFWFQFNLIIISLFFTIVSLKVKAKLLTILQTIGVLSFYIHITKLNYKLFASTLDSMKSIGTLLEMMPLAVVGCIYRAINLFKIYNNFSIYHYINLSFIIYILFKYSIIFPSDGFFYPNILLNVFASTILFMLFSSLSLEDITNKKLKLILQILTKYTAGIYYIHPIYRDYLRRFSSYFRKRDYFSTLIIYIICYINCFIGNQLFKNSKFKYLFL